MRAMLLTHERIASQGTRITSARLRKGDIGVDARAVQVDDQRAIRRHRRAHEGRLAPETGADMRMHHHAPVLGEERAELMGRFCDVTQRDVAHRPALEEAVRAIRFYDGGDAGARLGRHTQHRDVGIEAGLHGVRFDDAV